MTTLFISDLHLEDGRPDIGAQFTAFLAGEATTAEALYILGDLFEYWIRTLSDTGVPVYFMHGNRDFMIGERFAGETGATLLEDPTTVDLYGCSVMLSHGDALCTDDVHYQQMRRTMRNQEWQAMMRAKPLEERIAIAEQARKQSQAYNASVDDEIMDVNQDAVVEAIRESGVQILLHGHTHRPAVHDVEFDGRTAQRIVLGDWYEQGSVVRWDPDGPRLEVMPR